MATGLEKVSFHSNPKEGQCQRTFNCHTIVLISHASNIMLKILQARLQQDVMLNTACISVFSRFTYCWSLAWRITALQYCVGFCHTTTWKQLYVLALLNLPSTPPPNPTSLGFCRLLHWAPNVIQQLPISLLFYIWWCLCFNAILSISPFLPSPHCVQNLFS